jgi:RNA polymerase sigma factor (sigma-70 family)
MTTAERTTRTTTCTDHETDLAETELVAGARTGCPTCWREIVNRFDEHLQRSARTRCTDRYTAADAVQQTWLAAAVNIGTLRDAEALGGWLHRILHRECLRALNLRRQETPRLDETDPSGAMDPCRIVPLRTEPRSPEEEMLRREQRMLVQTALSRLPRRHQELLALVLAERRLPYVEISRRLRIPVGSIGPTRARCLVRLRRELAALGV